MRIAMFHGSKQKHDNCYNVTGNETGHNNGPEGPADIINLNKNQYFEILSSEEQLRRAVSCPHLVTVLICGGKQPRGAQWGGAPVGRHACICSGEVSGRSDKGTLGQSQTAGVTRQTAHILQGTPSYL